MGQKYIAILRGINVSGKNMIKMPLLAKAMEKAGFENIQTYLQSGNVIFTSELRDTIQIAGRISDSIKAEFDMDVPVFVLTEQQLVAARDNNPYADGERDETKLHITFLQSKAVNELAGKIEKEKCLPDEFRIESDLIYLYCPTGYGKTKLNNNFFESKLKQIATTRNWNTVCKLVELAAAEQSQA
jgi:uncharacterized protein (DUF1697 family)